MKKRYSTMKPTLETATSDQLFTELIKRLTKETPSSCYFISSTTVEPYPTWSVYRMTDGEYDVLAKEIVK